MNQKPNIKELRQRKGISQEELAEKAGLNLRTIQRIENGETDPRGDSLKKIAAALGVPPNEVIDWTVQEDRQFLGNLNLSALTFLVLSLLGIIVPFILWTTKKETTKGVNRTGKEIINFQITWNIILFLFVITALFFHSRSMMKIGDISPMIVASYMKIIFGGVSLFYAYNFIFILVNQFRINKGKEVKYFPKFPFLK